MSEQTVDERISWVLADIAAKRAIVGEPESRGGAMYDYFLMCLATVYSGHPDYREEWAV